MKKSLLFFAIAMGVVTLVGCTEKRGWSHDDRKAVRNEIDNYRDMVYLEDLEESDKLLQQYFPQLQLWYHCHHR